MKKHVLSFALVAAIVGSIAAGCSSTQKAGGADSTSTVKDSSSSTMTTDTTKADTTKKDTAKTPPKM